MYKHFDFVWKHKRNVFICTAVISDMSNTVKLERRESIIVTENDAKDCEKEGRVLETKIRDEVVNFSMTEVVDNPHSLSAGDVYVYPIIELVYEDGTKEVFENCTIANKSEIVPTITATVFDKTNLLYDDNTVEQFECVSVEKKTEEGRFGEDNWVEFRYIDENNNLISYCPKYSGIMADVESIGRVFHGESSKEKHKSNMKEQRPVAGNREMTLVTSEGRYDNVLNVYSDWNDQMEFILYTSDEKRIYVDDIHSVEGAVYMVRFEKTKSHQSKFDSSLIETQTNAIGVFPTTKKNGNLWYNTVIFKPKEDGSGNVSHKMVNADNIKDIFVKTPGGEFVNGFPQYSLQEQKYPVVSI